MTKLLELIKDRRRRGPFSVVALPAILAAAWGLAGFPTACTFDPNNRCGENQVYNGGENAGCVCAPGFALVGTACVACGANEVAGATGCVCSAGFAKASADAGCEAKPSGLGLACDSQANPCADAVYNHCEVPSGATSGYCTTTGCTSSADCTGGYACNTAASPAVCQRPPVGAGTACTSAADCAGTEATFCDTVMAHACLVQGCTVTPNNCFEGTVCCDLSKYGVPQPFCAPQGACPQ